VSLDQLSGESHVWARAFAIPRAAKNRVLASLAPEAYLCVAAELEPVQLAAGHVIVESHEQTKYAYFPEGCVVSLQRTTRDGASVEFAMVGSEGVLGIAALFEGHQTLGRAVVQGAGRALRLPEKALLDSCLRCGGFRSSLLRFAWAFNVQVAQRSVCHRVHSTEHHLCSWLLLMHDRSSGDELEVTQETLGGLLGARREGVSIAARRLRDDGLIGFTRGRLTIRDRAALGARSCECYEVIRQARPPELVRPTA
jgi:CRP-like cAMP-binding protein